MTIHDPELAIGRFQADGAPFVGLLADGKVYPVDGCPDGNSIALFERWDTLWPALRDDRAPAKAIARADLQVLAPVRPRQILCAGANYRKHVVDIMADHDAGSADGLTSAERRANAEKLMDHRIAHGAPFAFVKPWSAVLDPYADLQVPADSVMSDWELELAVVIGKPARRVRRENAFSHVAGYTIANDISARDHIVRRDIPNMGLDWITGKSSPGFLPLGPYIVPADRIADPYQLQIHLSLNDKAMQDEPTSDMIFGIDRLIEFLSTHMQLLPGDVICTGSPAGNGTHYNRFLRAGDVMVGAISGLGAQRNRCIAEPLAPGAVVHDKFAPLEA